jgi:hypothetical protein
LEELVWRQVITDSDPGVAEDNLEVGHLAGARRDGTGLQVEGGISKAAFEAHVERILVPTLRGGQIAVMDNLTQSLRTPR